MGRSGHGGSDRQRWEAGKHYHRERRDAQMRVFSPNWVPPVHLTTPGRASTPVHDWARNQTSTFLAVSCKSPRPRHDVVPSHSPTADVEQGENCPGSDGSCQNIPAPSRVETDTQRYTPQSRHGQPHQIEGIPHHFSMGLLRECSWKSGCRAMG